MKNNFLCEKIQEKYDKSKEEIASSIFNKSIKSLIWFSSIFPSSFYCEGACRSRLGDQNNRIQTM